ncbi:UNVERIFIED_CONTAM: hypothetical protein Sangu_2803100 [Sesamum angustifolium]|uniref:DDE Tnp4 domain-containing protein n=1 Tax=Sesamum angustifolium TaxID=2727405 RepID=A0AAW2IS27_9LAMI
MHKEVFFDLCKLLVQDYGLKPMRTVTIGEQLATFMMIVGVKEGNRQLQEILQRSDYTISKSFHNVLRACMKMSIDWVRPFDNHTTTLSFIKGNPRYFPHLKDCIGAIDRTHIKASLPCEKQIPFIGRKGVPTQNIMVACDFSLCFIFVLPGWEGSVHDTRIFYSAIRDPSKHFPLPPKGKYYLVNAGYRNISGFLAPYKGHKYHIPEFQRASSYSNHFEAFNHVHSSLRGSIERSFGIWKKKFYTMNDIPVNIGWSDQVALVSATMAIHNYIRKHDLEDEYFLFFENNSDSVSDDENNEGANSRCVNRGDNKQSDDVMNKVRDDICAPITFQRIGIPGLFY